MLFEGRLTPAQWGPMIEVTATVPASPDSVLAQVIDVLRDVGGGRIEVDHDRRLVAVQGGWWYRGEYQVDPMGDGTRLTHRVRNIASRARWAVPLANRLFIGFRATTERNFATFVANLTYERPSGWRPPPSPGAPR